jgi:hypothetical protein
MACLGATSSGLKVLDGHLYALYSELLVLRDSLRVQPHILRYL